MDGPDRRTSPQAVSAVSSSGISLRLGLRLLRREWRAGELAVLAVAMLIAVGSISAVGVLTDRLERAMVAGASELLAADLLVLSTEPIAAPLEEGAMRLGLFTARTVTFRSVVVAGEKFELAEAKAVSSTYPLRGQVRTAPAPYAADATAGEGPARGTVWPDPRLLSLLERSVGDDIELGEVHLKIDRVLSYEPDRGGDLFSIAPRVMFHLDDLEPTGLVGPGSRVKYRLLVAGPEPMIDAFRDWVKPRLAPHQQLQGIEDARPELRAALKRANQFLGLAALVSVLLAGVAIAMATRRYVARHLDAAAVLRCLGAAQRSILQIFGMQVLGLGMLASILGCLLGYLAQLVLANIFGPMLLGPLPAPSGWPLVQGLAVGLVMLLGFALPPVVHLKRVPPARVLRRDLGPVPIGAVWIYGCAAAAFAGLVLWQAKDMKLAVYVLGGGVGTGVALLVAAYVLVRSLGRLRSRVGVSWRFGIANITRRAHASMVQIVGFGLGIMLLLLLTLVRSDLLEDWRRSLPPSTPNYFLINVQPAEVEGIERFLQGRGLATTALYPMVRGRLSAINGRRVSPQDYSQPRARRLAKRDFNLSWAARLQPNNHIVAGEWWDDSARESGWLSIEEGIAETLGIRVGDEVAFLVAGSEVRAKVRSLRSVEWDSFQVNFFVVFPPGAIDRFPATYITSFHLPHHRRSILSELVHAYPSVTVIDVDALLAKIRQIMGQATIGAEYVFVFTLLAGFTVLFAATQTTLDERRFETAIVRTLGGDRPRLMRGLMAEFVTLGLLSGLLAAGAASVVGWVLAVYVFELSYNPSASIWLIGGGCGALGVAAAGVLGTRSALNQPPVDTLRSV